MYKTVPQVYRDCLRLIEHIGGRSKKASTMRTLVAQQFRAHANEKEEEKIEELKRNAMAGLANYLTIESLGKLEVQPGQNPAANLGRRSPSSFSAPLPSATESAAEADSTLNAAANNAAAASHSHPHRTKHATPQVGEKILALQAEIRARKQKRLAEEAAAKK